MKKQTLQSKLLDYSFVAGVVLLTKSNADSQIVYHHYSTPLHIYVDEYLDLNNDGIADLYFSNNQFQNDNGGYDNSFEIYSWRGTASMGAVNNCAIAITDYPYDLKKLNSGQIVNSSLSWCACNELLGHESVSYDPYFKSYSGYWNGQVEGLFGFRLKDGVNKYYGWMRMSATPFGVTLYDYAYNTAPNEPIATGETACDPINITIEATPGDTVCIGDTIILKANLTAGYSFLWKNAAGNSAGTDSICKVIAGTGDYFVIVTAANGCYDTSSLIHVAHINPMVATIYFQNDTLFSTIPDVVQWYLNGNPINGATDYYYTPFITGNYVVVTHSGNCEATSNPYYFAIAGTGTMETGLFPKISLENLGLVIELSPLEEQSRVFSITDMTGKKIIQLKSSDMSLRIPINELSAGEYILVIQGEKIQSTFRFFKI